MESKQKQLTKTTNNDNNHNKSLKTVYSTDSEHPIIDFWVQSQNTSKTMHYILKRSLINSFADILQINNDENNSIKLLHHFVLPDTYIVDKHCCFVLNDVAFLIYHWYDFRSNSCKLGLRYCSNDEVNDIEIPFHLLNDTYSETLSVDKVYIMNIAQKYAFYHKSSDQYLLFMDLTYRFNDLCGKNRNSMSFKSSVFMWQFQIDWDLKKIKDIAISAVKIDISLSGTGKYCLVCFDDDNGSILIHEKLTSNFVIKRLSDVVKEWKYYL